MAGLNHLILGAGGGIANAAARKLAARGDRVFLAGRNADKIAAIASELNAPSQLVDVTQSAQVDDLFQTVNNQFGKIDGVVHSVGSVILKPAHMTSDTEWQDTLQLNLFSAFYVLRAACKLMMNSGGGSIVLFSSAAARLGLVNHEAIAAAKGGVQGLTLSAASSYANRNIRINCIAPGLVRTQLTSRITGNEAALKASTAMHPLGRVGEPEELAGCIEWLLDGQLSGWVTGQIIGIDGGLGSLRSRT